MTKERSSGRPAYNNYSRKGKDSKSYNAGLMKRSNASILNEEDELDENEKLYSVMPFMNFSGMPLYNAATPAPAGIQNYGPVLPPVAPPPNQTYGQLPVSQMLAGQAAGLKTAEYNPLNLAQVNIQYTAPCGTVYTLSATAPRVSEYRQGNALESMLTGLYGIMASEDKYKGKNYSKTGKVNYAGGKGRSYSGSKGSSSGGGK